MHSDYTTLSKPTSLSASFSITPLAVNCSITFLPIASSKKSMFIPIRPACFRCMVHPPRSLRPQDRSLLPDRNYDVIVTDFGFTDRFERRSDDLAQTPCGSPCYAALELVISTHLPCHQRLRRIQKTLQSHTPPFDRDNTAISIVRPMSLPCIFME